MNYKDTLNILSTNFEMKANLNNKEPLIQEQWNNKKIYEACLEKNRHHASFILHDGPPYANGNIHLGHALNKILKDIIVRYKAMNGFYTPFIAGWDTHGLPIEHALIKKDYKLYKSLSTNEKRDYCKNFAIENVNNQATQFNRLGLLSNLKHRYLTLNQDFEDRQLNLFLEMVKQNLIFQDLKPIYWSWSSQTALAEAEIEYADLETPSIYVTFNVNQDHDVVKKNDKIIIWTTTPWTIPSNLAVAVHPDFEYVRLKVNDEIYLVVKSRIEALAKIFNWQDYQILSTFKGTSLENVTYKHPLYERISPIILADYVLDSDGTGLVHNAPGFGMDDYLACKKYHIHVFCPIDDYGKFDASVNDDLIVNKHYEEANEIIIERLRNNQSLLKLDYFTHSAAIDWRTKKPVIYRATKQWFVNIKPIQEKILKAIEKVQFQSSSNKIQLTNMIKNRQEWCISRQRVWGVPIPMIFDENHEAIYDLDLIQNILNIIKKEGTNVWFEKPVEYFLTKKYLSQNKTFTKEKDIMDVWFDSGSSFLLLEANQLSYPADLYLEGSDQYRGWFNSSLINAVVMWNQSPYKRSLSHGFVLDEQGRKMSKSFGNVIEPLKVCQELGADILRMWVANVNYTEDVRISKNIINQTSETYRKVRNTIFKFILANISDFDYDQDHNENFSPADQYILYELNENLKLINQAYENYDFASIIKIINNHVINLSAWYFTIIKDTLYCEEINDQKRRAIQTVLFHILKTYLIILTPITPHTCEEVYEHFNIKNKAESVMLENWINKIDLNKNQLDTEAWKWFFNLKDQVYLAIEKLRNEKIINKTNEATLILETNHHFFFDETLLKNYLNIAHVIIKKANEQKISVENSQFKRCERCWNYYDVNDMHDEQTCKRCNNILRIKK